MSAKELLIARLEAQLAALRMEGEFRVEAFQVWDLPSVEVVTVVPGGWSWGYCTSQTCNHYSHDPYQEGLLVWILCRKVGEDEEGNNRFVTPEGVVFSYYYEPRGHFAPIARLVFEI